MMMVPPRIFVPVREIFGAEISVCINSSLPAPELSISPPGRSPAVEVPNSRLTGPRPTRHHVFVVSRLPLTSHDGTQVQACGKTRSRGVSHLYPIH